MPRLKYNASWPDSLDDLTIELKAINYGGKWTSKDGKECGAGSFEHFMAARALLWPERYRHRWTNLLYEEFLRNDITILVGAASTQKTSHASEFVLINYFARPHNTLIILSTITMDKLDTGVFGEVKMLWKKAKDRYPNLPGNLLENRRAIVTDNLEITKTRDMRKGLVGRACYVGGKWVGLGVLAGTKQEYVFYLCDEIQFMAESFIGSWPNLFSNGKVKIIGSGNPKHDPDDQLGIAAEPKDGWPSVADNDKTAVWETQFLNGRCVNLVGTDSPNFDVDERQPEPYPRLIGRKFVKRIAHDWGENSPEFFSQVKGVMRIDMGDKRVITRQICRQNKALDVAVWAAGDRIKVYGLDPSYGGGDLCIGIPAEFGMGEAGLELFSILDVHQINIDMRLDISPEKQVAMAVQEDLKRYGIPSENCFYDPYGKGTMGYAFAGVFGDKPPIPVDSGGKPTERAVRQDLWVNDDIKGTRRLKKCSEHYSKFVTEAWFSVRYLIEAMQLRNLPQDVMLEGCARRYEVVAGNKIEVEAKDDYKARVKHSPNKFDALAVAVEGARQRGLVIAKLGADVVSTGDDDWFEKEAREYQEHIQSKLLKH
jgi:hypothetical protein